MKKDFKFFEKLGTIYIARIVYIEFRYMMAFFPPGVSTAFSVEEQQNSNIQRHFA